MAGALGSSAVLVLVIVVVIAARVSLPAGRMPVAATFAAIVAIFLSAAVGIRSAAAVPDRIRKHFDAFDRRHGIVALDHQLARPRTLFAGAVLNDNRKARSGPQLRREGIVEQLPAPASAFEVHGGHLEGAPAGIADR